MKTRPNIYHEWTTDERIEFTNKLLNAALLVLADLKMSGASKQGIDRQEQYVRGLHAELEHQEAKRAKERRTHLTLVK